MEKGQSKLRSFLEANVNTAVGFLVTLLVSPLIYKLVGITYNFHQLSIATLLFTLVSVIRGYIIRRFFNKREANKDKHLLNRIKELEEGGANLNSILEWYKTKNEEIGKKYLSTYMKLSLLEGQLEDFKEYCETGSDKNTYSNSVNPIIKAYQNCVTGVVNQVKIRDNEIKSLKDELDLCKHNGLAALSDLVEGADYYSGDESSRNEGFNSRQNIENDDEGPSGL